MFCSCQILSTTGWFAILEEPRPRWCRLVSAVSNCSSSEISIFFDMRTLVCASKSFFMIWFLNCDDGLEEWTSHISSSVVKDTEVRSPRSMVAMYLGVCCDSEVTFAMMVILCSPHLNNLACVFTGTNQIPKTFNLCNMFSQWET